MTTTDLRPARSGIDQSNIQEILDAETSAKLATLTGQAQFLTPPHYAKECYDKLIDLGSFCPATVLDPQCGIGTLTATSGGNYGTHRFGIDIDNRLSSNGPTTHLLTGNCVKVGALLDELYPGTIFAMAHANPPFGKKLKLADGTSMDGTAWTWKFVTEHANAGYFIASAGTIKELGIDTHPWVKKVETRKGNTLWDGMRDTMEITTVWWQRPQWVQITTEYLLKPRWDKLKAILEEEESARPKFNIYLNAAGFLKTYLSIRQKTKLDDAK